MLVELAGFESINRIRLEFKVKKQNPRRYKVAVLIESDWNLKITNATNG